MGEKVHAIRERLTETLEQGRATCTRLQEKAKATANATDKTIRNHPYQSIGVALGIGILVGLLITRKH